MAIFDLDGNELDVAYSLDGVALAEAYDIDGNPLYEDDPEVIDDIDLSNVESYFVQPVRDAMAYVKNLGTRGWVHHIVITDTHNTLNYLHSAPIVEAMQSSNYFSKVIHLGDVSDSNATGNFASSVAEWGRFNGNMLLAIGNHDVVVTDYQTLYYDNFLSDDTDIVVDDSDILNFNYYWDDTKHKIRYIVCAYTSGGRNYVLDKLKTVPTNWSVLTLCHYPDTLNSYVPLSIIGKELNYIGNLVGHMHIDGYKSAFESMYNQVMLNNDGHINDDVNYPKTQGTSTEQCITIMSINTSTKNVKFYRIGIPTTLGQNWQYTYVKGGSVDGWYSGGYWGTGTVGTNANGYISTKKLPAYDEQGNVIQYYVYTRTGTLVGIYILGLSESGEWVTNNRLSNSVGDVFNRKGGWNSGRFATTVKSYSFSCEVTDLESTDDIVITTVRPNLGRGYTGSLWQTGSYLNSAFNPISEETSATTYAFDVLPNTTYRFYVDDVNWEGSSYMCAFTYKGTPRNTAYESSFAISRRLGNTSGTWKEITFTTNEDEYYCRISVQGLASLDSFASKCSLEIVS